MMKCWHCQAELIWGGDHDYDVSDDFDIVTNLSCPTCHAEVLVYYKDRSWEKCNETKELGAKDS